MPADSRDLVVVGSGVGGFAAAIRAHEKEHSVCILEKAPKLGGSSGLSGGQLWVPDNHLLPETNLSDSVDEATEYLVSISGDLFARPDRSRHYVESVSEAIEYFDETIDLDVMITRDFPDYYENKPGARMDGRYLEVRPIKGSVLGEWDEKLIRSQQFPQGITFHEINKWGGFWSPEDWNDNLIEQRQRNGYRACGSGLLAYFLRAALERDIDIYTNTQVDRLLEEDGRIHGVEGTDETGGKQRIEAREGVVLNTGSYDWNPELIEGIEHLPEEEVVSTAVPTATGDGLVMAAQQGAQVAQYPPVSGAKLFVVRLPGEQFMGQPAYRYAFFTGLPGAIMVNREGKRFTDESFYRKYMFDLYDPSGENPHFPCYVVFDESFHQNYQIANYEPGEPYDDEFLAARADTLESLAEQLDLDPGVLSDTIERFNDHARQGHDPDFGRGESEWGRTFQGDPSHSPNPNLGPLEEPPYYAIRLYYGLNSMSNSGLITDEEGQVLDWRDEPVEGLYATGSVCAPIEWGIGYQSGLQNGRSLTFGYLIGKHL